MIRGRGGDRARVRRCASNTIGLKFGGGRRGELTRLGGCFRTKGVENRRTTSARVTAARAERVEGTKGKEGGGLREGIFSLSFFLFFFHPLLFRRCKVFPFLLFDYVDARHTRAKAVFPSFRLAWRVRCSREPR